MAFTPYYPGGWQSGEEGGTPITPAALNHYDDYLETTYTQTETDAAIAQSTANIGTVYNQSITTSVTFTGSTKEVCALTLPPGIYVVTGDVRFDGSVANGRQGATLTYNNADGSYDLAAYILLTKPASTENQYYNVARISQITATNNTVYLMAYDAALSGTRTIAANLWAVRIK